METPIKFLDAQGKIFFECHPAEARVAIEAVKDYRKYGSEDEKILKEYNLLLVAKDVEVIKYKGLILKALALGMEKIEIENLNVTHLIMNTPLYGLLRLFPYSVIEMETDRKILETGRMAKLWQAAVFVNNKIEKDMIYFGSVSDSKVKKALKMKFELDKKKVDVKTIIENTMGQLQEALGFFE